MRTRLQKKVRENEDLLLQQLHTSLVEYNTCEKSNKQETLGNWLDLLVNNRDTVFSQTPYWTRFRTSLVRLLLYFIEVRPEKYGYMRSYFKAIFPLPQSSYLFGNKHDREIEYKSHNDGNICPICYLSDNETNSGKMKWVFLPCSHGFHRTCIINMIYRSIQAMHPGRCPMCRDERCFQY